MIGAPALKESYYRKILDNGLEFLVEEVPYCSSVAVGVWVVQGSRREDPATSGISHFIEHMLFKGTARRSSSEIARTLDAVGGKLNAFTGKELTCLHATVLKEDFGLALDLLSDLLFGSLFKDEDIENEKGVVVEEINMYEDNPVDHISDLFVQTIFPGHPLGQPISGRRETIQRFNREEILAYYGRNYRSSRCIVSVAGNITFDEAAGMVSSFFGAGPGDPRENFSEVLTGNYPAPEFSPRIKVLERELNQVHICLGTSGMSQRDESRYAFTILNLILGGGMSSRLFQNIREKYGLVYAVSSSIASFYDTGYLAVYAGTDEENLEKVIRLILTEMKGLAEDGVTEEEIGMAKGHLRGSLLLGMESTEARMSRLATHTVYQGRIIPLEEMQDRIESVSMEDIRLIAREYIKRDNIAITLLGSSMEEERIRDILTEAMK